jgi:hypothetical protein
MDLVRRKMEHAPSISFYLHYYSMEFSYPNHPNTSTPHSSVLTSDAKKILV